MTREETINLCGTTDGIRVFENEHVVKAERSKE